MHVIITFISSKIFFRNMGPKTTPSLISKGGVSDTPPPPGGGEIETPWEIGLTPKSPPSYRVNLLKELTSTSSILHLFEFTSPVLRPPIHT